MMTPLASALSLRIFPHTATWLREILLVLVGSLFLAACAQIVIPLQPVPITGQTFGVLLIGATFGAKRGAATIVAYLIEGALGLPFFAAGKSGPAVLVGPTAGYLFGFVVAAWVIGWMAERGLERTIRTSFVPFLAGTGIIYLFGVSWLAFVLGDLSQAIAAGVLPFLVGDAIKLVAAAMTLPIAWRLVRL